MKWKTKISQHKDGKFYVRGVSLEELIQKHTFTEVIFLLLKGQLPSEKETKMLDAVLVATAEHGVQAPSTFVTRVAVSTGNPLNAALAAGILTVGEWHGGAVEKAAQMLQSEKSAEEIVADVAKDKEKLAGYGHKVYKDEDPRTVAIFAKAKELGLSQEYIQKAIAIQQEFEKQSGKKLPINIDGAIAAIISELGFDWRLGKAVFALGRMPGMIAHAHEEIVNEKPYRRLEDDDVEYVGP
ncbi:MAG: citryl-CoA lyase [Candidatus Colwellbacteria bacterium]|nr:citryl-CoA lyase [Candidatus Colwellbacteria bacterium]